MNNQQIIEKAAFTLNDLSTGGLMNAEQSNAFIKGLIAQPTILKSARTVSMASDTRKIEKIGFGQRILRPGVEGTPLAEGDKAKPSTGTVELNAKEVIAQIDITYDTLENNIEGDNLKDVLMNMIIERAALDIEELVLNGDTASADSYLALLNGLRKQSTSHVVDHAGTALSREVMKKIYKAVPAKYLRNPRDFRYFASHGNQVEWMDLNASRNTTLGDQAVEGRLPLAYGVPVEGVAMLQPYDIDGAGTGTALGSDILLTHPKNIVVGFSRNIRLEVDKDITARKFIIVLTAKMDAKFEEEDAVAKGVKILEQ